VKGFGAKLAIPIELILEVPTLCLREVYKRLPGCLWLCGTEGVGSWFRFSRDPRSQWIPDRRSDRWGGNVENRSRFGVEVTKAVVEAIGVEKVGYQISPHSDFQGMRMEDPYPRFKNLVTKLATLKLAYLHVVTARMNSAEDSNNPASIDPFNQSVGETNPILIAGAMNTESARILVVQ